MSQQNSRKEEAAKSGHRSRLIWWISGAIGALFILVYLLAIQPQRERVNLSDASSYNILLITLDTTRADHLGCYGHQPARTPSLDRLALEGIRFGRAYCPAPLTLPSHCSILTGLEPVAHGVRNNGHDLPLGIRTLAEILKAHGYTTSAFVSSFSVDSRFGLGRGFDIYDDTFQAEMPFKTLNSERRAEETFTRFSRWLESNGQNKFFSWVHYYDPHWPYNPPSPYAEEFSARPYDGEIAYMDYYVGAIANRLREEGILGRTIVIIAGDHGEGLGDKVEIGHGIFLYEETLRVPLILFNTDIFPHSGVIDSQVRLTDLAPTLLEIIGLKDEAAVMKGQSLVAWIKGKSRKDLDCLVESFYPRENFGWSEMVGLISGRWKLIQSPQPELYDLETDPEERKNLYTASAGRASKLKEKLQEEILRASSGAKPANEGESASAQDLERLRSLGYVNLAPARPGSSRPDPKDKIGLIRLIQQAQAYEFEEKYAEAEQACLKILEEVPDSPAGYINLAIVQALQNKFDRAIETLNSGLARIPDSLILLVRLGDTYLVTGKIQKALETMNKVLTIDPHNVDALTVCASILDATGRKGEARSFYERALAIEPESRYLRIGYAGNLASTGRLTKAISVYQKLIADFPEEQALYQYVGIAYSYLGEYDLAISYLNQAIAIGPTPVGFFNLALTYEKSGNLREAAKNFRRYLEDPRGESEINIRKARAELERLEKQPGSR